VNGDDKLGRGGDLSSVEGADASGIFLLEEEIVYVNERVLLGDEDI